jgi:hypothetical protein
VAPWILWAFKTGNKVALNTEPKKPSKNLSSKNNENKKKEPSCPEEGK